MNIFTVLVAVILYLWLPLSIIAAVIAVAVLLAWSAVRSPRDTQSEPLRSARRATVAVSRLGLAAALAVVRLATGFWRATRRGAASLPVALKSLTVEPPSGGAFNDSRDVWPMPRDD
ncbi:hypothetical protein [Micromonospora sp. NPDC048063]|uniref:hypothetical protein n=1 Tax=Micromonospora sp. NPDC048063 TaxID=3364256 RepID=UPI00371D2707